MTATRAARIGAALFVVTAALFAIGVSTEPSHDEATTTAEADDESTEGDVAHEAAEESGHDDGTETREGAHREEGEQETVLGVDVESPGLVALAVIASIALAAGLWFRPLRPVALAAVGFAVLFAILDIAEVLHQSDEDRSGFAVLAAVIAAGHLGAAGACALVARTPSEPRSTL